MKKMKSLLVAMLVIASVGNVIRMGNAQGSLPPLWGYITDSHGNDLPEGVEVIIRDLTKSTETRTYTIFNSKTGRTSFYQLNSLDEVPNCEDGDWIEVYCSYNGEDNSVIFRLENSSSITSIEKSFLLIAPPSVETLDATDITSSSAKLKGELIDLGGDGSCKVWFEYGKTTAYGYTTSKQTKYAPGSFSATISGLQPDTTYHFRVVAQNSRKISYGNDLTFHTPPALPSVATQPASNVGYDSATLNGYLSKVGASSCQVWFVYDVVAHSNWKDYAYSTHPLTKTSPSSFSYTITNLQLGVEYHFRAVASNAAGTVAGNDLSFTPHVILPSVTTLDAINITSYSAILRANLTDLGGDESCKVWFEYGTSTLYGFSTEMKEVNESGIVEIEVYDLQPGTVYHFRAVAENSMGKSYGYDMTFETLAVKAKAETKGMEFAVILKGNLTDMGGDDACYVYFEYWEDGGEKQYTAKKIMSSEGEFSDVISGLKENTTYYYRAVVENSQGISYGMNLSFKTLSLPSPPSVETMEAVAGQNNATLYANISDMGESNSCYLWFEYWNDKRMATEVIIVNSTGKYGVEIDNL
ncbi:MAG: fibronectin type III domain-containing protein, partial [Thermoplasmata archaeon]|nr:fibronectin type III domain-containing protein [Thermoplasmata archaeon]